MLKVRCIYKVQCDNNRPLHYAAVVQSISVVLVTFSKMLHVHLQTHFFTFGGGLNHTQKHAYHFSLSYKYSKLETTAYKVE